MAKLVRKNVFLDPEVLRRAQEILGAQSESEAIREALNLVAFRQEVMQGFDQVAGKVPDFGTCGKSSDSPCFLTRVSMYPFLETQPSLPSFDHAVCETSLSPISVPSLCRNSSLEPVPPGSDDRLPLSTNPLSVSDVSLLQAILSGKR